MAVYKPTYCLPFLNTIDARLGVTLEDSEPCIYLTCKIDTSNKDVTGYSIRLLDSDNNQLFPLNTQGLKITAIKELQDNIPSLYEARGINSGKNGTYLKIPFFQNYNSKVCKTYNGIYYKPRYVVDYLETDITNWNYVSTDNQIYLTNTTYNRTSNIVIDGEPVLVGDYVLFISTTDTNYNAIWQMSSTGNLIKVFSLSSDEYITIKKGTTNHSKVFHYYNNTFTEITDRSALNLWVDYDGNTIQNFNPTGNGYKWEITMYQGNYDQTTITAPSSVTYDNLADEWYDMKVGTGTILGSTPKRIQIANKSGDGAILPSGTAEDALILQTRYMQMFNRRTYSGSSGYIDDPIGTRIYVQSYDSTFGHVYPLTDSLDYNTLSLVPTETASEKGICKFYKHSNNPENILDGDIVECAINTNITFDPAYLNAETYTKIRYVPTGTVVVQGYTPVNGDRILLMGQTDPKQNGVYIYDDGESLYEGETTAPNGWSRAGSFLKWGDYIGVVLYVSHGALGSKNYESLAGANGDIWDPKNNNTGSSPLYFSEEKPMVLFHSLLKSTARVKYTDNTTLTETIHKIDGIDLKQGDLILYPDSSGTPRSVILKVVSIPTTTAGSMIPFVETQVVTTLAMDDYVYIAEGEHYGKTVFKIGAGSTQTQSDDLSVASILQNTKGYTYISPNTILGEGMKLKLLNNKTVDYTVEHPGSVSTTETSQWLDIDVLDKTLWRIKTKNELVSPIPSYDNVDTTIPYKYEARSYYKNSDENPFTVTEEPYIILSLNGQQFSELSRKQIIKGRSVKLSAKYISFSEASWESYRWILADSNGKVLQDTGEKYDKSIEVYFYGLANDSNDTTNVYYASLYLTDNLGNTITRMVKLYIAAATLAESLKIPFTACFDRNTHSVKLDYQDNGLVYPVRQIGDIIQAFVVDNPASGWDESIFYTGSALETCNAGYDFSIPVDKGKTNVTDYSNYRVGKSIAEGVKYSNYFSHASLQEQVSDKKELQLNDSDTGQILLETSITLDDNYCGQFMDLRIQRSNDEAETSYQNQYLHIKFAVPDNFSNANNINPNRNKISISLNMEDANTSQEPANASNVSDFVKKISDTNPANVQYYTWFDTDDCQQLHYLQWKPDAEIIRYSPYYEFLHLTTNSDLYLWMLETEDEEGNPRYFNSFNKFLGNLNLVRVGDIPEYSYIYPTNCERLVDCPSYWVEDRKYLIVRDDLLQFYEEDVVKTWHYADVNNNTQLHWPTAEDETSAYWNEVHINGDESAMNDYPISWDNISEPSLTKGAEDGRIAELKAIKRHTDTLSHDNFHISVAILNISELCEALMTGQTVALQGEVAEENNLYRMSIIGRGINFGTITFRVKETSLHDPISASADGNRINSDNYNLIDIDNLTYSVV